jgi:BirA family biotin operon repressor/biotin-[acetyl-CoA-carboxylase] ligase
MSEAQAASLRPPALPPAYRLIALESVGSTNDAARVLAADGAEDGTLVWAREQTAGRGRQGRDWTSPPGNLYCSLVLRPDCPTREAVQLAFVAALGVAGMVGSHVPPLVPLRFKWPNDVLLGKGKIGGILMEAEGKGDRLDWMVLGVGVNLASHPDQTRYPATDIRAETDTKVSAEEALVGFSRHFLAWTNRWLEDGFAPIREAWLARAAFKGETIDVRLPNETLTGRFADIDASGALVLETPQGVRCVTAGDVHLAGA